MIFNTNYPYLFIFFSLLASVLLSYLLYAVNTLKFSKKWQVAAIGLLRFFTLFLLFFLLLEPMLNLKTKKIEKPLILIAVDNSKSITTNKDSIFYKEQFPVLLNQLSESLKKNYKVEFVTFGSDVKNQTNLTFSELQTNISKVFVKAENDFANLNLGAVILATDGIFNAGQNPEYIADKLNVPVFTIGMGDTTPYKDILIKNIKYSEVVFEGNNFTIAADILYQKINKKNIKVWVEHNGKVIAEQELKTKTDYGFEVLNFVLQADKEGLQTFNVKIEQIEGEISYQNNSYTFQVNVLKNKQKIYILANTPHPDVGAIKQALDNNVNITSEVILAPFSDLNKIKQADMLFLHLIPDIKNQGINILQAAMQQNIPLMFVLGPGSNYQQLAQLFPGLSITSNPAYNNTSQAYLQQGFNLFIVDEKQYESFAKFPPLTTPYGNYKLPANAQVLFNQQIGYTKTANPMLFFIKSESNYTGFLLGEGFWRWRLHDFLQNNNHNITNDLINKCVQLIAVKNDKSKFRVRPIKSPFYNNDNIEFEASLFNDANELTNIPDASISLKHESGKTYQYQFSKANNFYVLNAGELPEGKYSFTATALQHKKEGNFMILPQISEYINTTANHSILYNISKKTNGNFYLPSNMNLVFEDIEKSNSIKPVMYENTQIKELLNLKWIFVLIVALITIEWFIRKYNGYI